MTKQEILTQALEQRDQEILGYQINIDNYTLAIKHIQASNDSDLEDFKNQLERLLNSEIIEQKKAKVLQHVIRQQLEDMT
jgi:hypothetical protein